MRITCGIWLFLKGYKAKVFNEFQPSWTVNLSCRHIRAWSKHYIIFKKLPIFKFFKDPPTTSSSQIVILWSFFHSHRFWPNRYFTIPSELEEDKLNFVFFCFWSLFSPIRKIVWKLESGKQITGCVFSVWFWACYFDFILTGLFYNYVGTDIDLKIFVK